MSWLRERANSIYTETDLAFQWCHKEFRESANNFMRDMRSMKSLFNYLYLLLYMYLCVWGALYHAKDSLNTAIITTGGIVSSIFMAYVWSTTKEKMNGVGPKVPPAQPKKTDNEEEGASD